MIQCRSCHEPLIFARSSGGKNVPFDRQPNDRGKFILEERDGKMHAIHESGASAEQLIAAGPDRYISHFATCPFADQHRRKP